MNDVIMTTIASQITSLTAVYSTVYSDVRRSKKTPKLRVTGLWMGNSPGPVNSPHKGPVTRKMFPFDDVIISTTCTISVMRSDIKCKEIFTFSRICSARKGLTRWSGVTHICVGKLTIIDFDNGLSPDGRQATIWTSVGILLIGSSGIIFSEISIENHISSCKKTHLKMSGKCRPFVSASVC